MEYTENKSSKKLIIFEITCVLIIIALIGYTYSYFNVSVTNDTTISGRVASLSLTLNVSRVAPSNTNGLIPQLDQYITSAVIGRNGSCIDDNNNNVCQVYQIKVKNTSSVSLYANGTVTLDNKNNPNLKWAQISGTTSPTLVSSVNTPSTVKLVEDELFTANQEKIYYIVVWISETGEAQYDTGNFTGTVTFGDANTSPAEETFAYLQSLGFEGEVSDTILTTFTTTSKLDGTTGIYTAEDDLGTSYYFRGDVTNNYVNFAGYYWRIIRINGDGSIRMIYMNEYLGNNPSFRSISTSPFNLNYTDNAFLGYMNGTVDGINFPSGGTNSTSYEEAHTNLTNSSVKEIVDSWYESILIDSDWDDNPNDNLNTNDVIIDSIYCNDRKIVTNETYLSQFSATTDGFGTNATLYGIYDRILLTDQKIIPTFTCSQNNDKFTVSEELGNGALTYPIGLMTIDELIFAGVFIYPSNPNTYLHSNSNYSFWTMTPIAMLENTKVNIFSSDAILEENINSLSIGINPVISISPDIIQYGTGTSADPFRIASKVNHRG